jgi:membrane protein required for beta-lactamase induction
MASYAFFNPIQPGKVDRWKKYVAEMTGRRRAALAASRKRAGLRRERVWLQRTPAGDFAVVYWEAGNIGKVFQHFMSSTHPFDTWFRD